MNEQLLKEKEDKIKELMHTIKVLREEKEELQKDTRTLINLIELKEADESCGIGRHIISMKDFKEILKKNPMPLKEKREREKGITYALTI